MSMLMASVPPLLRPPVSNYGSTWARQVRRVRPSRATSGRPSAPSELLLLHAAADLVDDLGAELDHVEGVQHLHRVGQRVAQRVGVAAEPVERSAIR